MAPPRLDDLHITIDNGIAIVKYNVPSRANALRTKTMQDILQALKWATDDSGVKVVVFTGEGKFYSTGLDVTSAPKGEPVLPNEFIEALREVHKLLINMPKVLIAAVNGAAAGWGVTSIALFDLIYSVPDAFFFTPFAKLGLCAEGCSSVSFAQIMGRQKASNLLLAGERMTAQELESAGLITKLIPKEGFFDQVMKIARRIADQPLGATQVNKRLVMRTMKEQLLAANEIECDQLRQMNRSQEHKDAVDAYQREQKERKSSKI